MDELKAPKKSKSCLVKSLIALLVVFVGLPLVLIAFIIPIGMISSGDGDILCRFVAFFVVIILGILGIVGFRRALKEEYYLHAGTSDIFQSSLIGALNLSAIILIGYAMFYPESPAWLAIPGAVAFIASFIWVLVCTKSANNENNLNTTQLLVASCGRMFLISLTTILSALTAVTAITLRDTLKAKGSKASVRVKDALDFNLKHVRIWGKNLGDNEVVMLIALLGFILMIGKHVWTILLATRNQRKNNAFTAFTFGASSLAFVVAAILGSITLVNQTRMPVPMVQNTSSTDSDAQSTTGTNTSTDSSSDILAQERESSMENSSSEISTQDAVPSTTPTSGVPVETIPSESVNTSPITGATVSPEVIVSGDNATIYLAEVNEEPVVEDIHDEATVDTPETPESTFKFSLAPDVTAPVVDSDESYGPSGGAERAYFQQKLGFKIIEIEKMRPRDSLSRLYRQRLLALLPLVHQGDDVNITLPETKGNTPLHYACALGDAELVEILLDWGADPTAVTDKGKTPMDCVGNDEAGNVRKLLQKAIHTANAPTEVPAEVTNKICNNLLMILSVKHDYRIKSFCEESIYLTDVGATMSREDWSNHISELKKQWPKTHFSVREAGHFGFNVQMIIRYAIASPTTKDPYVGYLRVELGLNEEFKVNTYADRDFGKVKPELDSLYTLDMKK